MEGRFIQGYHTAQPLKIVQNTVGEGDLLIEMYVREYKGEAIKNPQQDSFPNGKIQSPDQEEERQNPHKIRFDAHLDVINKADKKKYGGKTLRFSIHELVPAPTLEKSNTKGKNAVNVNTFHPIQECPDRSTFDEAACVYKFPTTKLLSNEFD